MNKIFSTFNVFIFLILLILGSTIHLMYGSCQTSKYHYICQVYWMPDYLPKWMIKIVIYKGIIIQNKYHDKWTSWHRNGVKYFETLREIKEGKEISKTTGWNEKGSKIIELEDKDGRQNGKLNQWDDNGIKVIEREFKDGVLIKETDYLAPTK